MPAPDAQALALSRLYGSEALAYRVRGRKSMFRDHMYKEGEKLAALGMIDNEIAEFWGVSRRTLKRWMANKPDFCHIIKKAKSEADLQVESTLFKKAKGYDYIERHYEYRIPPGKNGKGKKTLEEPVRYLTKEVTRHVQPDIAAIIFWLLNRQRERWKDKRQLKIAPDTKLPLEIIISNGDQSRRITSGDETHQALPAPRKGAPKP